MKFNVVDGFIRLKYRSDSEFERVSSSQKNPASSEDVERVRANAEVERFLACQADHALVRRNARSLEGLAGHLMVLARFIPSCDNMDG